MASFLLKAMEAEDMSRHITSFSIESFFDSPRQTPTPTVPTAMASRPSWPLSLAEPAAISWRCLRRPGVARDMKKLRSVSRSLHREAKADISVLDGRGVGALHCAARTSDTSQSLPSDTASKFEASSLKISALALAHLSSDITFSDTH